MSSVIGLISDIHGDAARLRRALAILAEQGADPILCGGDIAGYGGDQLRECVDLLAARKCVTVQGNHDVWYLERRSEGAIDGPSESFLRQLPVSWEDTCEGLRLCLVHASPPASMDKGITLLDQEGKIREEAKGRWTRKLAGCGCDVLVVGHTHQVFAEQLGQTLVINPGSSRFNNSCAVLSLPDALVRFFPLEGDTVQPVWHWGMMVG